MEINYTGHPLFDVGLATVCAFNNKESPAELTEADLEKTAAYIETNYVKNPLKSFLTVAFTKNAWFSQNAYDPSTAKDDEDRQHRLKKRAELANYHLRSWKGEPGDEKCVFSGLSTLSGILSSKLNAGRAGRAQIPMTQGDEDINFFPYGDSGLPVSGLALLCLQAFPLGCAKCAGKLLTVHTTSTALNWYFANKFWQENQRLIVLAQQADSSKLAEAAYTGKTLLIKTLLEALHEARFEENPPSISAYHLSNGQSPEIDIYNLPLQITHFLAAVRGPKYYQAWQKIVQRGWRLPDTPKKKATKADDGGTAAEKIRPAYNSIFEDLFDLPQNAARFVRAYFLRLPRRRARENDPTRSYQLRTELDLISWDLLELFLERIMLMTKERIEDIRTLGDRLAAYITEENDKRFFQTFFNEQKYDFFRTNLLKALRVNLKKGSMPLITLDQYLSVFEEGSDVAYANWKLSRDLVLIRMIEKLHSSGWLKDHADALPEETVTEE